MMRGIATQFVILERTIERSAALAGPELAKTTTLLKDDLAYAYLGAIGTALTDFDSFIPNIGKY
jgi:hypothetical protein